MTRLEGRRCSICVNTETAHIGRLLLLQSLRAVVRLPPVAVEVAGRGPAMALTATSDEVRLAAVAAGACVIGGLWRRKLEAPHASALTTTSGVAYSHALTATVATARGSTTASARI